MPEWAVLEEEKKEIPPNVCLFIYDTEGNILRKIKANNKKGFNRITWDF